MMLHRKLRTLGVPVVSGLRTGVFAASQVRVSFAVGLFYFCMYVAFDIYSYLCVILQFSRHFTAGAASGEDVKYLSDVIHDHESPDWFPERRKKV
jgi:hypothetical protein